MKTYYICKADSNGQRTGTYYPILLSQTDIWTDNNGQKYYKDKFLYEQEAEALRAALN
jgi:hypothetical protein